MQAGTVSAMRRKRATPLGVRLALVVGPSGAGKDTIISGARAHFAGSDRVAFPRRLVTREPDASEPSRFVAPETFETMAEEGRFALHWHAHGFGYGIAADDLEALGDGCVAVCNVSRAILPEAVARFDTFVVLVTAMHDVLERRLTARGREDAGEVANRLAREGFAMPDNIPHSVIENNGTPEEASARLVRLLLTIVC